MENNIMENPSKEYAYQWFLGEEDIPGWDACLYIDGTPVKSMNYGETMVLRKQKKEQE